MERAPTTSILRSALYYQNRIIISDKKTKLYSTSSDLVANSSTKTASMPLRNAQTAPMPLRNAQTAPMPLRNAQTAPMPLRNAQTAPMPLRNAQTAPMPLRNAQTAPMPLRNAQTAPMPLRNAQTAPMPLRNAQTTPMPLRNAQMDAYGSSVQSDYFNTELNRSSTITSPYMTDAVQTLRKEHCCSAHNIMDSSGINIVITDTDNRRHTVKKESIWKRIHLCLQDNRMKSKPNAEQILASSNPLEYRILKKFLNIIFLTVGIALLVAVVTVILYTTIDSLVNKAQT